MTPLVLEHITLTTGHTRASPRSEVGDDELRLIVNAVRAGGQLWAGWAVSITPLVTGAWQFTLLQTDIPVVTCWLCSEAAVSDTTWETAKAAEHLYGKSALSRPRGVPWLAVALLPTALAVSKQHLLEAGDAERCIAWAILDHGLTLH